MRTAAKRDVNEREIIDALEKIGCSVAQLDQPVDLLVGYRARNFLIEVKDGNKSPSRRVLTPEQKRFFAGWKGQVLEVTSIDEALELVTEAYR